MCTTSQPSSNFGGRALLVAIAAVVGGCTNPRPAAAPPDGARVKITYVGAHDVDVSKRPYESVSTRQLTDLPSVIRRDGPYLSIARKCNAQRTVCKLGVLKLGLEFTAQRVGGDWVLEGAMVSSISRSETVTLLDSPGQRATISETVPPDAQLINDEATGSQQFRWVVQRGEPLELAGPLGSKFRLEAIARE
jgi:hypothetical protein